MTLSEVFLKILNTGLTAGYVIVAVCILRLLLQRFPRKYTCFLWGIVLVRLLWPWKIESIFSLLPSAEPIPMNIDMMAVPGIDSGLEIVDSAVNPMVAYSFTPDPVSSANPLQIWIPLAALVWCIGMLGLILYTVAAMWRLKKRIALAVPEGEVFRCEVIQTPFVSGIFQPRIYIPMDLKEPELSHVLLHERMHLKHRDHIWKPIFYLAVIFYWFNPLVWPAYYLFGKDLEMACDEAVLEKLGMDQRADYCESLLHLASERNFSLRSPLAFGENHVKQRIQNLLHYKKPKVLIAGVLVVIFLIAVLAFATNPISQNVEDISGMITEEKDRSDNSPKNMETGSDNESLDLQENLDADLEVQEQIRKDGEEILQRFSSLDWGELEPRNIMEDEDWSINVVYLAELPEKEIVLYGYNDREYSGRGVAVDFAGDVNFFDWYYLTPRLILPELYWKEAERQLQVSLYVGSGTGIAIEELHVLYHYDTGKLDDFGLDWGTYSTLLEERIGYFFDEETKQFTIYDKTNPREPLIQMELADLEGRKIEGLSVNDLIHFQLGEEIWLEFVPGYYLEGIAGAINGEMPTLAAKVEVHQVASQTQGVVLEFELGEIKNKDL